VQRDDAIRDPGGLLHFVGDACHVDLAGAVLDPGDEPLVGIGALLGRELADQDVRGFEDPRAGAEVGVEGELGRLAAVELPELVRELEEVEERRSAPRVDVLIGVADRRHRMPVPEDTRHQPGLRHVGVLVFVEEDRRETVAILTGDLRVLLDDLERQLDLITEVDHSELTLQLTEHGARSRELDPLLRGSEGPIGPVILQLLQPMLVERDDLVGRAEVVRRLVVEGQDPVDDPRHPLGLDDFEGHPIQDTRAQLDTLSRCEDPLVRLDADQHSVTLEELGGEPVVVGDLRLLPVREVETRQRVPDASLQVLGRLVREGEAEDVAGEDARMVRGEASERHERQVDHSRSHHGGLPRPGTRDQHVRLERPRDRAPLLLRGSPPTQDVEDLLRIRRGRTHAGLFTEIAGSPTSKRGRPSGKRGQSDWNSQKKQFAW
jgi:hypothetical protein